MKVGLHPGRVSSLRSTRDKQQFALTTVDYFQSAQEKPHRRREKMRHCAQKGLSRNPGGESDSLTTGPPLCRPDVEHTKRSVFFFFFVLFQIDARFGFVFFLICCYLALLFFSNFCKFISRPCVRIKETHGACLRRDSKPETGAHESPGLDSVLLLWT